MSSLTIINNFIKKSSLTSFETEQLISWAKIEQSRCQWYQANPAPNHVLTDDLVTNKYQAD